MVMAGALREPGVSVQGRDPLSTVPKFRNGNDKGRVIQKTGFKPDLKTPRKQVFFKP